MGAVRVIVLLMAVAAAGVAVPPSVAAQDQVWSPPADAIPAEPTYLYLEADPGEYYTDGGTTRWRWNEAAFTTLKDGGTIHVGIEGDAGWGATFKPPAQQERLREGYYGDLSYPDPDSAWAIIGKGSSPCQRTYGWLMVDDVAYDRDRIERLHVRFEMRCGAPDAPALRAAVGYDERRRGRAYNPRPDPGNLWSPSAPPDSGWYVVTEDGDGDPGGAHYVGPTDTTFTADNATIAVDARRGYLDVAVTTPEDRTWTAWLAPPRGYGRLRTGYYAGTRRFPFHNPAKGGVDWSGDGRGCNTSAGWLVVDEVTYDELALTSLEARFEHQCEERFEPMHIAIRWNGAPQRRERVRYSDTATSPHREAIHVLTRAGLLGGYDDNTFRPGRPVTRGQMATFLVRALRLYHVSFMPTPYYTDTDGHTHEENILLVGNNRIAFGYPDQTFRPDKPVERGMLATVVQRAFGYWERDGDAAFSDIDRSVHEDNILLAAEAEIASGFSDGTFGPERRVTRGQLATMLYKALTRTPALR